LLERRVRILNDRERSGCATKEQTLEKKKRKKTMAGCAAYQNKKREGGTKWGIGKNCR